MIFFLLFLNSFETRERDIQGDTQGGEINYGTFFGGKKAGVFGGVEIFLPKLKGTRLKIEYDSTNYTEDGEGYLPVAQDHKINYSFVFPLTKDFHLKLGYVRNNTLNFENVGKKVINSKIIQLEKLYK